MLDLEIRQAMEKYENRLCEADQYRLYREALDADPHNGQLRKRVAAGLGSWLVAVGRRLEGQNGQTEPVPTNLSVRISQQVIESRATIVDCGQDGHLAIEGTFRKVA